MRHLETVIIALTTTLLGLVLGYNYVPLSTLQIGEPEPRLGATLTTLNSTDQLSDFPTVYNANNTALNNAKLEISDFLATTSMPTLVEVGTLTTGTWNADTITVPYGGTGSTSLASNQVLLGNGSSLKTVAGFGTAGQFLTSNGAGAAPTFQTSAVDQGITYTWTALHQFTAGLVATASSTFTATTTFNGNTLGVTNTQKFTASTTITGATTPQPVSIATSTGAILLSDANANASSDFAGYAVTSATNGNDVWIQTDGVVDGFSGLTAGSRYYVQDIAGTIGTTVGTVEIYAGTAISTTELFIDQGVRASWQYAGTTAVSVSSGSTVYKAPYESRFAIVSLTASGLTNEPRTWGNTVIAKVGNNTSQISYDGDSASDDFTYTLTWGSVGISVNENQDEGASASISGDIYWYR